MKHFTGITSEKELKAEYKRLCLKYHPDIAGESSTAIMQEITAEYKTEYKRYKKSEGVTDEAIENYLKHYDGNLATVLKTLNMNDILSEAKDVVQNLDFSKIKSFKDLFKAVWNTADELDSKKQASIRQIDQFKKEA